MDISKQGEVDSFQIAKQVDDFVGNPTIMRYWRQKTVSALNRSEINRLNDLEKLFRDIDLTTDIEILYALLAFCHDDLLRINYIIPDFKKLRYPHPLLTMYHRTKNCLDVYLSHVKAGLQQKADLAEKEEAERGKFGFHPKKPGES
jgi:hypothetical protein